VDVVDYAAVDDCGVRINPQIVEGQVHGATAHAIGAALHEDFVYDEEGTLLTANFYDYHVPHALDMPPLRTGAMESPSPVAPLGAKGMGEGAAAASTASAPPSRTHCALPEAQSSTPAATQRIGCGRCSRTPQRRAPTSR
jgi:CO/xanthine dehydrogenase Mo-binding subunit